MLKKTLAILLVILTLFISCACTYSENTTSVSSDTESEVIESESLSSESESESEVVTSKITEVNTDTQADTREVSAKGPYEEIDIMGFVGLDRKFEEGDKYPSLTKDEILSFDKNAYYIGTAPIHSDAAQRFRFFIGNNNCSLFGHNGFLYYSGELKADGLSENVTDYSHELYHPCYEYIGDGSEVLFESDMVFTIPNVTYNEYLDILNKAAEFTKQDVNDIKIIYDRKYTNLTDLAKDLNIDNYDDVVNVDSFEIYTNSISIPDCNDYPFYIKIDWLSESHFSGDNRRHLDIYPFDEDIYNCVVIRVYWSDTQIYTIDEQAETYDFNITGKFLCSSDYHKQPNTSVPSIAFSGDGHCILSFNYYEGGCDMQGKYRMDGDKIYVYLNFDNTIFEDSGTEYRDLDYMSDNYIFTIVNDNELMINRGCYSVNANDSFVRVD